MSIEVSYVTVPSSEEGTASMVEITFMLDPTQLWQLISSLGMSPGGTPFVETTPAFQLRNELAELRSELGWTDAPNTTPQPEDDE